MARRMAEEAIALDPKYAGAYALVGWAHSLDVITGTSRSPKDSIAKALEWTQKALVLDDSLAEARSRLGVIYTWSGRYDEGIAEAERAVEGDPNSGQANYNLSVVLRFAGKSKEAIPVMQKVLRLEPMAPDSYLGNQALIYLQAGDCKEALAVCDKLLKRKSDNLVSYIVMAGVYGFCGGEKEARKETTGILRLNPKFAVEPFMRSIPYKNQSDKDRMIQGLRKAGLP